jgi:hypothetical protein
LVAVVESGVVRSMFIFLSTELISARPCEAGEQAQRQRRGRTRCP